MGSPEEAADYNPGEADRARQRHSKGVCGAEPWRIAQTRRWTHGRVAILAIGHRSDFEKDGWAGRPDQGICGQDHSEAVETSTMSGNHSRDC
jgi:hypothetical protein